MLKPIKDRIVVRLDIPEQKHVIITSETHPCRNSGIIESMGSEVKSVKTGDHIVFHRFDELPLPQDGLVIIRENSVLGIYTNDKDN